MKISSVSKGFMTLAGAALLATAPLKAQTTSTQSRQNRQEVDTFTLANRVSPYGTKNESVLANAPSANVKMLGQSQKARIVVDLNKNILYTYDQSGNAEEAFLVASGKKSTPTTPGYSLVTHVETYPFKTAPVWSKRRKNPAEYGPKIICLTTINPKTGAKLNNGEFIHGNNDLASIGKHSSHGCIRMANEIIVKLAQRVKRGDIVVFKK